MLLEAYERTGDEYFLRCAGGKPRMPWSGVRTLPADGIISSTSTRRGFTNGMKKWVPIVGGGRSSITTSGNCTFDDDVTAGATGFLLDLYTTTLDPRYRVPLIAALDFILESQYPNGGWPQRYPLRYDPSQRERRAPTTPRSIPLTTASITGNIHLLLRAYSKLGNEAVQRSRPAGNGFRCDLSAGRSAGRMGGSVRQGDETGRRQDLRTSEPRPEYHRFQHP